MKVDYIRSYFEYSYNSHNSPFLLNNTLQNVGTCNPHPHPHDKQTSSQSKCREHLSNQPSHHDNVTHQGISTSQPCYEDEWIECTHLYFWYSPFHLRPKMDLPPLCQTIATCCQETVHICHPWAWNGKGRKCKCSSGYHLAECRHVPLGLVPC